ncbi:MAG: leucine-rich repeat protein, partial [Clostridia bacterium]|nr:leucine-rich repeat protein [Clostridia bacterium]
MNGKKIKVILSVILTCILCACILCTVAVNLNSGYTEISFESFEEKYLNIIDNYASATDGQIVISGEEGLYEQNGCLMIDGNAFSRMTGASVTCSDTETDISFEDKSVNIKDNTISSKDGDVDYLTQEIECYDGGGCAFPVESVAEALGYKVDVKGGDEEKAVTLTREFSTKRLIVKYKGNLKDCGAVASAEGYDGLHIFQYADEQSTANAFNYYKGLSCVEYVESDEVVKLEDTVTESVDAAFASAYYSWGADAMGVGNYASHIQNTVSALPEIIVAVIDTGIDTDHEWFTNRIAEGGKNYSTSQSNKGFEYEDDEGHGTHVSGIIKDLTLDNVKILPIKVMNKSGVGYASSIALGVKYVTSLKKGGAKIRAFNMSLGGTSTSENASLYQDCISEAADNGILPVVAAGNENQDTFYVTPANIADAVCVSAVANAHGVYYRPYYSNFGGYVDVCAPGSAVISAKKDGGVVSMSGTSMAAPHVAAAAALIMTEHNGYTIKQVEDLLENTAVDLGDAGKDKYYGYGMVSLRYIYADLLSGVSFSETALDHTAPFDLTISHTSAGAKIYYTTGGTLPTPENGVLYTSPINISRSVRIRAAAYVFDGNDVTAYSNPKEITYRFGNQDLENCFIVDEQTGGLVRYNGILTKLTVPQIIDGVTIKSICSGAFSATGVVNVILPDTVTDIEDSAFRDCKVLETVKAPAVKSIGNYAFQSCPKFKYVNDTYFPEVTKIGAYAFYQCANLRDVVLSKVEVIGSNAFYMRGTSPQYLTRIDLPAAKIISDFSFNYASYVTEINLPEAEIISEMAFNMNDIESLSLPKAVYLGSSAFFGNDNMASADLPEAVYLSTYAIAGSTATSILSTVNLPKAKIIGSYVISNTQVKHIDLPSAETLLSIAFYTARNLETFTAPNLKYLGSHALGYCEGLTEINLPSVITLSDALYQCTHLEKITLSPCLEKMTYYSSSDRGDFSALRGVPETCVIYYYKGTAFEGFYKATGINNPIVDLSNDEAFNFTVVSGEAHITGINGTAPDTLIIPSYIEEYPVTKICAGAFENCSSDIKLNVSYLKEIEENAFSGCTNLTEVYLTRINAIGENAFANCTALKSVKIDGVTDIGAYAFNGCTALKEITLPDCVESIGEKALGFNANALISDFVIYGDADSAAQTYAAENGVEFKAVFENLKGFYYDTYINEKTGNEEIYVALVETYTTGNVIIPSSYKGMPISKIGKEAFSDCLISGVVLPDTVTEIEDRAFSDCHFMESINLENVTVVGEHAFRSCQMLKYVNMPQVQELPWGVFSSCNSLVFADLSGAITIGQDVFNECYSLEQVICPNLVTLDAAFHLTTSLKSVDTENVVKIIGKAFTYSKSLEELSFPNLETITDGGLFSGCESLKKVFIGKNFKSYEIDVALDMASWTYYDVPIYGYSGSLAEEWAYNCRNEDGTKHWTFTAVDEEQEYSFYISKDLPETIETGKDFKLTLSVEAEGRKLSYQWYKDETGSLVIDKIKNATKSQYTVDTSKVGTARYYVIVKDWRADTITSQVCEVTVNADSVALTLDLTVIGGHVTSPQSGVNAVKVGQTFSVKCNVDAGYHITSVNINGTTYTQTVICNALTSELGLGVGKVAGPGTVTMQVVCVPNEDTAYTVYHYKESLEETEKEIDGKYYELEAEENLTGTTDTQTNAVARTYEHFTAGSFEQKNIGGDGDTVVEIFYDLDRFTVTVVDCEGVTVEGNGTYAYGQTVAVNATVDNGYEWIGWVSSDAAVCPDTDELEVTFTMPAQNMTLTANAQKTAEPEPPAEVGYVVYHYKESLTETDKEVDGKYYVLEAEENLTGTTDTQTAAVAHEYEGFTSGSFEQKTISGNGDTVVEILYNRNTYMVTLVDCEGVTVEGGGSYAYGQTVVVKVTVDEGYEWIGWESSDTEVFPDTDAFVCMFMMPAQNMTLTANAQKAAEPEPSVEDIAYVVYHFKESLIATDKQVGGKYYSIEAEENLTGTADTLTNAVARDYEGFTASAFEQKTISENGDTVVEIFYNRNTYTVTVVGCEGVTVEGNGSYAYGQTVVVKATVDEGYEWVKWVSSDKEVCPDTDELEVTFTMPVKNMTLTANAQKKAEPEPPVEDIAYVVYHYKESLT